MKKFYIATQLANAQQRNELRDLLCAAGHEITYDWTKHGSLQHRPDLWRDTARAELSGVAEADFVVILLPGGQGAHVEFGMALGMAVLCGVQVFVVGADLPVEALNAPYRCLFYDHPEVLQIPALRQGVTAVNATPADRRPIAQVAADIMYILDGGEDLLDEVES